MANSEGGSSGEESDIDSKNKDIDLDDFDIPEKKRKPGIIYLSSHPEGMNVSETTAFFAQFGRVGRMYLKPGKYKKLGCRVFDEGWIEFLSKKVARRVADEVNNTPVGGKRRSKSFGHIWNIKYLPRFKWVHLSERLNYEQQRKQQRLNTEIAQEKRNVEHFTTSVKIRTKKRKAEAEEKSDEPAEKRPYVFKQIQVTNREDVQPNEDTLTKTKSKKTKKGHKSKDKEVTPKSKLSPKSVKSKKDSRKSESKSPSGAKGTSTKRTPKKSPVQVQSSSMRRRSGDSFAAGASTSGEGGGGGRSVFLKSIFGGGTS